MLELYTDGSCKNNGGKNSIGAYGYIAYNNDEVVDSLVGVENDTTNNRMELKGVLAAAEYIKAKGENGAIYTDSAYIHNCLTQKWYINWRRNGWVNTKKQPVKNRDLWERLLPFFEDSELSFHKVKGHADDKKNNEIDRLVQNAAGSYKI